MLSATEDHSISFRQVHTADGGRIRYQKVCEIDGEVLDQADIGKGFEIARDRVVLVTDEELAQIPLPTAKACRRRASTRSRWGTATGSSRTARSRPSPTSCCATS
ncbi:Ku protein [Streptomyces thermolilacinus]